MSCNCNQNRRCSGCFGSGRTQHIRVGQNVSTTMSNGPYCCRHACCCRCQCSQRPDPSPLPINYACLRRAERDFERRVARCMGMCGFNESNALDEEENTVDPYTAFAQKYDDNE